MQITLSSLFITLMVECILILLFYFIITARIKSKFFRIDFLTILIILILLRLLVPIELPFTVTVPAPIIMNPVADFFDYEFIEGMEITYLLLFIWGFGCIFEVAFYVKRLFKLKELYRIILNNCKYGKVSDFLKSYSGYDYPVYISPYIPAPMVLGFKKVILLPKTLFSEEEISNILLHEIYHIEAHDIYVKQLIKFITIIYWWFPPIYLLQREIDLFLELRADSRVTKQLNYYESLNYANTLISVRRKILAEALPSKLFSTCLLSENKKVLSYRINYLIEGNFQKRTGKLMLLMLLMVPILSNSIILEPCYPNSSLVEGTFEKNDFEYIIQHKDGSYSLMIDNQFVEISDIHDESFDGIRVIKEK